MKHQNSKMLDWRKTNASKFQEYPSGNACFTGIIQRTSISKSLWCQCRASRWSKIWKKKPLDILEQFYSLTQALLVYCVLGHRTQRKENNCCSKVSEDIRPISPCTRIRQVKCNRYEKDHAGWTNCFILHGSWNGRKFKSWTKTKPKRTAFP